MERIRVSGKGQVIIPAHIRRKYGIRPGMEIGIFEYEDLFYIVPLPEDPIGEAMGCLPKGPSLSKQLIKERTKDFAK
jgi:AbrB family looped-hinge helix DNA binding protein